MSRFPVVCTLCAQLGHLAKDCPQRFGKSQQERDMADHMRGDRNAVLLFALCFVLALVLFGLLERGPA